MDLNKSTSNLPPGTFVVLADPQLTKDTDGEIFENLDNVNKVLNSLPTLQYPNDPSLGITCARNPIGPVSAVFFAGDMTQFGGARDTNEQSNIFGSFPSTYQGGDQLRNVRALYDPWHTRSGVTQPTKCGPLYFGLGNHDLEKNDSAWTKSGWRFWDKTYSPVCDYFRYQMWDFIAQMHTGFPNRSSQKERRGPRFPVAPVDINAPWDGSYDWKRYSLNYVVHLDTVDVYQLHRYGGDADHGRATGLDWLKLRLALGGYRRPVVIVQHFPFSDTRELSPADAVSELWTEAKRNHLMEILMPYNVIAVFVGHDHTTGALPNYVAWPNAESTLPAESMANVKPNGLKEIRQGAAKNGRLALIRVEDPRVTPGAQTNILYGAAALVPPFPPPSQNPPSPVNWIKGFGFATPDPPALYVRSIQVVCMDKADENTPRLPTMCMEMDGQSSDINEGFGGSHVYIRPLLTDRADHAISSVEISITKEVQIDPPFPDLAKGTRGDHIYIKLRRETSKPAVTGLYLVRSKSPKTLELLRPGMAGMTGNINQTRQGKNGTYLYLVWRTQDF